MPISTVCYIEIPAPNITSAMDFYRTCFGWNLEESFLSEDRYCMFRAGDLQGGLDARKTPSSDGILIYLGVDDIQKKCTEVVAGGGRLIRERGPIGGGYGQFAIVADPNGNLLGLWERPS